jgi:hypothetical protein
MRPFMLSYFEFYLLNEFSYFLELMCAKEFENLRKWTKKMSKIRLCRKTLGKICGEGLRALSFIDSLIH